MAGVIESIENLIAYCRENGRICPMPQHCNALWKLLPNRKRVGGGWEPALPLILAAWDSPSMLKMLRLVEHIEWAKKHGAITPVAAYLRGLPEDQWFHRGD